MILVPLIVVPCAVLGIALVTVLDRMGAMSGLDGSGQAGGSSGLLERTPRLALISLLVLLGAWVLAWIVLLVVGLGILSA